ncbi:signal peptidase I [Microbacterium sp. A84]|uniref:signal peptidase I n=1 Tax=Microbacterium sp. A84 TaxID=3450715 RepID=UPI003F4435A0
MNATSTAARVGKILREVLLTLAAVGGVICILLTVLAFTGGFSLIMFKTGSMSPTIPAGSVALVQKVPASDIAVDDIVTVDRPAALPVTHRVTSVKAGSTPDARIITMRGDANDAEDPAPYIVKDVRMVRGSVPYLAHVIVWFGNPIVLGALTIGAAVLVTWAFWPKDSKRRVEPDDVEDDDQPQDEALDRPRTRRELRGARVLSAVILLASGVGYGTLNAPPAHAVDVLSMSSDLSGTQYLSPADPLYWHIDVDAGAAPEDGTLMIALSGTSTAPDVEIVAEVRSCAVPWVANDCSSGETLLRETAQVDLNRSWEQLLESATPAIAHLRVALTSPTMGAAQHSASLTVRANAAGETAEEDLNGEPDLPPTGGTSWAIFAAPAAIVVGLGIALMVRAGRKKS